MARLYKGQSVPTKVGTYREQEQSSIDAAENSMVCRARLGTYKKCRLQGRHFCSGAAGTAVTLRVTA